MSIEVPVEAGLLQFYCSPALRLLAADQGRRIFHYRKTNIINIVERDGTSRWVSGVGIVVTEPRKPK